MTVHTYNCSRRYGGRSQQKKTPMKLTLAPVEGCGADPHSNPMAHQQTNVRPTSDLHTDEMPIEVELGDAVGGAGQTFGRAA